MDKEIIEYRNALKELFKKYALHKCIRLNVLNGLLDEINQYYKDREICVDKTEIIKLEEFHEQHLKQQLEGWLKHLNSEHEKLIKNPPEGDGNTAYGKGVVTGFGMVIQKLKDVAKR